MPRFASYWLRRWISKAKNKIFLVDVETIVSRLPCASMKLLSWNQVFKTKKDCWNVWIRTFKTQQIWRCYKYYSRPHRITRACRLADAASAWKLRGTLNLACPCRSKTEQKFSFATPQWQAMDIIYPSLGGAHLKTKIFPFLLLLSVFLETSMKLQLKRRVYYIISGFHVNSQKIFEKLQILNFQHYHYQNSVNFRTHQQWHVIIACARQPGLTVQWEITLSLGR